MVPLIRQNLCPISFVDLEPRAYIDAILGVYELNRVELLTDVFLWAYERSTQHYAAISQSLGQPNTFRLQYRNQLIQVVGEVVRALKPPSVKTVAAIAKALVPPEHLDDFVRMAIGELENLHEGNFARFRVRPSEFQAWQAAILGSR
jgi:hypothetical protein